MVFWGIVILVIIYLIIKIVVCIKILEWLGAFILLSKEMLE